MTAAEQPTTRALRAEADAVVQLARMSLAFGRVERLTYHEDGVTRESDTDHTVMLALIACAFAARHPEMGLDVGLVAQFAIVHDLPEVYAGDTPTLRALDPSAARDKQARENEAANRIARETSALPWAADVLEMYEQRELPEARYVKAMDKVLPKLTHILNGGVCIREGNMSLAEVAERYAEQDEEIRAYAGDFPLIFDLRAELIQDLMDRLALATATEAYPAGHGYTPATGPFADPDNDKACRVMLARYPCNWTRAEHDPDLPPEDLDVFGYRRAPRPTDGSEG